MKNNKWVLYLFEDKLKKDLFKIMEFRTIKDLSYVLDMEQQTISNWFHGLINPRGILNYCVLYQTSRLN